MHQSRLLVAGVGVILVAVEQAALVGLRFLHPFDSYRARRVYVELRRELGLGTSRSRARLVAPLGPVSDQELLLVHTPEYLDSLRDPQVLATAIEVMVLALTPRAFLNWCLVTPMRWAVSGTLLAFREALREGLAFNLTGGFHHAKTDRGEGFCLFNDIAYAIKTLQAEGRITTVLYVDLDAHQGNGVCQVFASDPRVKIFDVYNAQVYPQGEDELRARLDASFPLQCETRDDAYLELLERELPPFMAQPADLVVYNAGSDIVRGDRLGALSISPQAVLRRDQIVIKESRRRGVPLVFLPSGGYTRDSYRLISRTIIDSAD